MVTVLEDKQEAIAELCLRHGVARLFLFGSALRDDFRPGESDVDLLVEFGPMDPYAKAQAYFDMLDELRSLLGMDVDLVMTGAVKTATSPATSSARSRCCMPRSAAAYLADIVEACDAIKVVLRDVDLEKYQSERPIRSAVEREFIIIGEAVASLARVDPGLSAGVSHARLIVGFRNQLAHDYASVDDETVLAIAEHDVPVLRRECSALLETLGEAD